MVRPWSTITPAAIICPPSLISASTPHLSSRTPSSQISPAPDSSARGSSESVNSSPMLVSCEATSNPAHSPPNIAMPPSRGVGSRCTSRALIRRHRARGDGELPHGPRQQIGHRSRDAERQQIFTHGLPRGFASCSGQHDRTRSADRPLPGRAPAAGPPAAPRGTGGGSPEYRGTHGILRGFATSQACTTGHGNSLGGCAADHTVGHGYSWPLVLLRRFYVHAGTPVRLSPQGRAPC